MPLRDHFRPPVSTRSSWEGLHGGWPMAIVLQLSPLLPARFAAEPRVHLADQSSYEVLIYDHSRDRRLVAAIEIVSPGNKDRLESRRAFVTKCAALLQQGVCVSVVDLVTTRQFNLYGELLSQFDRTDTAFLPKPPSTYAATCRCRRADHGSKLTTWAYPLSIGAPLPTLPIWLDEDECMSLELEASYEETCRALRIT